MAVVFSVILLASFTLSKGSISIKGVTQTQKLLAMDQGILLYCNILTTHDGCQMLPDVHMQASPCGILRHAHSSLQSIQKHP